MGPTVVALVADSDDVAGFRAILRVHSLEHKVVVYVMQGTDGYHGASRRSVYVLGGHLAQIQSAEFAPRGRRIDWCIYSDEDNALNAPALAYTLSLWDAQNPLLLTNLVENDVPGGRILGPTIFSAGAWHMLHRVVAKLRQDHPSRPMDIEADGSWFRHALPLAQSRHPSGEAYHFGAGTCRISITCWVVLWCCMLCFREARCLHAAPLLAPLDQCCHSLTKLNHHNCNSCCPPHTLRFSIPVV